MSKPFSIALALVALLAASARAQLFIGPGSTPQGDYLRGVGVAAWGEGLYNLNTARANRIQLGTDIMFNEYVAAVHEHELAEKSRIRAEEFARHIKKWAEGQDRILNRPEEFDIRIGDALNSMMRELNKGAEDLSALRKTPVLLPVDVVRRVPFKLDEEAAVFSMQRLMHKGVGAWPVAFQGNRFDRERARYEAALGDALEQQIVGKIQPEAIQRLEAAVEDLQRLLDKEFKPEDRDLYNPASLHLIELRQTSRQFKSAKIEAAISELDTYAGVTVNDLRAFMQKHKLAFGIAERPEERRTYREVYAALVQQREGLDADRGGAR